MGVGGEGGGCAAGSVGGGEGVEEEEAASGVLSLVDVSICKILLVNGKMSLEFLYCLYLQQ